MSSKRYLLVACAVAACAPAPAAAPPAVARAAPATQSPASSEPPAGVGMTATGWSEVTSRRFFVAVPLPERRSWQVDDTSTPWLVARQPGSDSQLLVRTWAAQRLVRPAECEQQARLWRPDLPAPGDDTTVDSRTLEVPSGYHTQLVVAVQRRNAGITGFALAFGAAVGRCYALVYSTSARGRGAETAVGRRLAIVVDGVAARVRGLRIEDRVHP